jgi:hypothetical protein
MKTRTVVSILILILAVLIVVGSCATGKKAQMAEEDLFKKLSGTWVNTEYLGTWEFYEQKLVVYPDGKHEYYPLTTDTNPTRQGYFLTITEAWTDSAGVIWYKAIFKGPGTFYVLGKISDSGNTWEWISDGIEKPTEWDTTKTRYEDYGIRYRQE